MFIPAEASAGINLHFWGKTGILYPKEKQGVPMKTKYFAIAIALLLIACLGLSVYFLVPRGNKAYVTVVQDGDRKSTRLNSSHTS